MSTEESSKNNWVIDAYDPLMRLEYEDGPVPHGTSLIIKHGLTGQVTFGRNEIFIQNPGTKSVLFSVFVPKKRLSVLHLAWRKK